MEPEGHEARTVVLVVEDDALLLMTAIDMLEDAGFNALSAANADAAIRILESRDDIRIVFTDIDMPGSMDGLKLAACVRDRWPPVEIVVTSGHVHVHDDQLPPRGRFFKKPYQAEKVVDAMRAMVT